MSFVTDGKLIQLGLLSVRLNELYGRARRGVYASIDEVSDAVQMVIEGKKPIIPALAPFVTWKTFHFGGGDIETVALTATDFGYDDEPTVAEMFDSNRLDTWSRLNADRLGGYVVEALSRGDCATIRLIDDNKSEGEVLFTATGRQWNVANDPRDVVFDLHWRLGGKWEEKRRAEPHQLVNLTNHFLFRFRKVGS